VNKAKPFCKAGQWELDDGRLSRPVLGEREGETPSRHSTIWRNRSTRLKPSDYKGKDISFFIIGGYQHGKEA